MSVLGLEIRQKLRFAIDDLCDMLAVAEHQEPRATKVEMCVRLEAYLDEMKCFLVKKVLEENE